MSNFNAEKIKKIMSKYKYALIVALLGIIFMLFPTGKTEKNNAVFSEAPKQTDSLEFDVQALEKRISDMLSRCDGVGQAEVLITQSGGVETVYERDTDLSLGGTLGEGDYKKDEKSSLSLSKSGANSENPVITRQKYPELLGALIICEGGENDKVRLSVTEAVRALTGISASNISVIKMKKQLNQGGISGENGN